MNQIFGGNNNNNNNQVNNPNNNGIQFNPYYGADPNNFNGLNNNMSNINNVENDDSNTYDYEKRNVKRRKIYNADLSKVIKSFCVFIILFGLALIGSGVYGIESNKPKLTDEIVVSMDQLGSRVTITITSQYPIQSASYRWDSSEETPIETTGKLIVTAKVKIIQGNHILRINVTDKYGNVTHYQQQYLRNADDSEEPTITVDNVSDKIQIVATDNSKIAFLTYRWNDEEETRIEPDNENSKVITVTIAARRGENKLTVNAQDAEGNIADTYTRTIFAAEEPKISLSTDGNNLIIKATDEEGIKKISVTLDGVLNEYTDEVLNKTEATVTIPLTHGQHVVDITVENTKNVKAHQAGGFTS